MSVDLVIRCDGCSCHAGSVVRLTTGKLRGHKALRGWSRTRGTDVRGRRLRLDWCPTCTTNRARYARVRRVIPAFIRKALGERVHKRSRR